MKVSYNWLKQYIDMDLPAEELSRILTDTGLEVEGLEHFESVKGGLKGVVVGKVLTCTKHPDADKLSVTTVDVGTGEPLPIVCGAPNVEEGQKVLVATVGTTLYMGEDPLVIKKAKIRGEESQGMICAEDELGLGTSHEGIMVLDDSCKTGAPATEYFPVSDDYIFEIGLTPNRTDAMSHVGVARDIVAALNRGGEKKYSLKLPGVEAFSVDDTSLTIPVEVRDTKACPRYSGLTLTGLTVEDSPVWLKNYLNAAGIRPLNNIVDITNFVMLELGQPLHAFDAEKLEGSKLVVRPGKEGEKFKTLDGEDRKLSRDDLMICDAASPMCIGGVFGGINSGVTKDTTRIFLESAYFNPVSIRKTSRYHGLQTDASFRFERGTDPEMTVFALKRAALLMKEIAGGKVSSEIQDVYPQKIEWPEVYINQQHINRLAGQHIPMQAIQTILTDLGIEIVQKESEGFTVRIPLFKSDVTREADVIEEILRIYGYNNIEFPAAMRSSLSFSPTPDPEKYRDMIANMLTNRGFSEIMNNSLTASSYAQNSSIHNQEEWVRILNPLSGDLDVMRQDLVFGVLETILYNQNRKASDLKLFEFGNTYRVVGEKRENEPLARYIEREFLSLALTGRRYPPTWSRDDEPADLYDLKGYIRLVLERIGWPAGTWQFREQENALYEQGFEYLHNGRVICSGGSVSSEWLKKFDIRQPVHYAAIAWHYIMEKLEPGEVQYSGIPRYPAVKRDLALLVDRDVRFSDLRKEAFDAEKVLLRSVRLFDVYEGNNIEAGKKSYALSFTLQDERKTLTDKVIEKTMARLIKVFEDKFGAIIRK